MKIDKNIKIVNNRNNYPIAEMKIGDSFFVEVKTATEVYGAVTPTAKKKGFKLTLRTIIEDGKKKGTRVWRIK